MPLPAIAIATEHYNRIVRILQKDVPVTLEVEVQARFTADDLPGTNIVAEIPGVDKKLKSEIVMLGGHFDTWHAGTGATDDGAGCAVAFEAMRILKTLGVQPRRTIRMALWDAEEQGFVGSRGYVANHFFDRAKKEKKPEYDKLAAYFNFDNGSGKIRGIYAQGNSAVVPIFEAWLEPVRDLGAGDRDPAEHGRHGPPALRRRRPARLPVHPGRPRVRHADPPLEHGRLRPPVAGGPDAGGHGHGLVRLQRGHARGEAAAEVLRPRRPGPAAPRELENGGHDTRFSIIGHGEK